MIVNMTATQIKDRKVRTVEVVRDIPSGHVKKGQRVLALHKMRIFIALGGDKYDSFEMDGQLFSRYFKELEPIVMI